MGVARGFGSPIVLRRVSCILCYGAYHNTYRMETDPRSGIQKDPLYLHFPAFHDDVSAHRRCCLLQKGRLEAYRA